MTKEVKKTTLYSRDKKTQGKSITLPVVGDVTFDSVLNSIEVDEEKVESLLQLDFGIKLSITEKDEEEKADSNVDFKKMLRSLDEKELKDLLSAYPEAETKKLLKRSEIINYLFENK